MTDISLENEHIEEKLILDEYEEIIGKFIDLDIEDSIEVTLSIRGQTKKLTYPNDSKESDILEDELRGIKEGRRIGILRTDLNERPICIREV